MARTSKKSQKIAKKVAAKHVTTKPVLLSGGNPPAMDAEEPALTLDSVKTLRPIPPGESKQKEVRYLDIHEDDEFDEAQLAAWVKQASQRPGKQM